MGGAWMCSAFRNEGPGRASVLIREAVSATRATYGDPPALGIACYIASLHPFEVFRSNPGIYSRIGTEECLRCARSAHRRRSALTVDPFVLLMQRFFKLLPREGQAT